jgi:bacterial/archaeal transporter family protein
MLWVIYALIGAVFMAIGSICAKKVMKHEHALEFGAGQNLFSLFILVFFLPFIKLDFSLGIYAAMFIIAVVYTAGNIYFFKSIRHSELSSAMPLMNISPLFLLIVAFVFLHEEPSQFAIIGVLLLAFGTYVLQKESVQGELLAPFKKLANNQYAMYMIFAMLLYSFVSTMEKSLVNQGVEILSLFVIMRLFVSVNYLILEGSKHGLYEVFADFHKDGGIIVLGSIASLLSFLFYYLALGVTGALVSLVIPISRLSTVISIAFGGTLFHEKHIGIKLGACVIMLFGIVLIVW